ncbi:AAA family ATPase [Streptomyces sp. NPDC005799]|uniref:helix-turn-helix transcriptional regulator n=1 Tax=Streptomyces sp. NPDC005799 TaxID=3154678 RepID=UPI0033C8285F
MIAEREAECSAVANALRRAEANVGSLLVVTGPLGIGKSELLNTLGALAGASSILVVSGQGAKAEQSFTFGVVLQLFEPLLIRARPEQREQWLADIPDALRRMLSDADGVDDGQLPPEACPTLLGALEALLLRVADSQPLLILIDDVQWTDSTSLRWLAYIAKRLTDLPIVMVAAVQEGDLQAERPLVRELTTAAERVLRLRPLSRTGVRTLLEQHYGEVLDEAFVTACHKASGGNPLYLALAAAESECDVTMAPTSPTASSGVLHTPLLLERLVMAITSATSPIPEFAQAMAVLGDQVDIALAARLANLDDVRGALAIRKLTQLGLLSPQSPPRFVNPRFWDAVRTSVPMEQIESLRSQAAALLYESGYPNESVAQQLLPLTNRQGTWAIGVLREAAQNAVERGALRDATRCLRRALLEVDSGCAVRGRLLTELAAVERRYDPDAATRHVLEATSLLDSAADRARAVLQLDLWGDTFPITVAHEQLRSVADELSHGGTPLSSERELATQLEARIQYIEQGTAKGLVSAAERLQRLGSEPPVDTAADRELAAVLSHGAAFGGQLDRQAWIRLGERILERAPAVPDHVHTTLGLLVPVFLAADSPKLVADWLNKAAHPAERSGGQSEGGRGGALTSLLVTAEQALVWTRYGAVGHARQWADDELRHSSELHRRDFVMGAMALAAVEARDTDLASRIVQQFGRQRTVGTESLHSEGLLHILHGMMALRDGNQEAALEEFLECGRLLERSGWHLGALHPWRTFAAVLQHRLKNTEAAWRLVEEDVAAAQEWGAPAWLGRALRTQALLSARDGLSGDEDLALLRRSVTVLRDSGHQLELARSLMRLGLRLADAQPDTDAAREANACLAEGSRLADTCGVPELAGHTGAARRRPPGEAFRSSTALTRTQRLIAELAAQGMPNRDIAEQFGVTQRAVEKHLTNTYRKLGLNGRRDLAQALRDLNRSGFGGDSIV